MVSSTSRITPPYRIREALKDIKIKERNESRQKDKDDSHDQASQQDKRNKRFSKDEFEKSLKKLNVYLEKKGLSISMKKEFEASSKLEPILTIEDSQGRTVQSLSPWDVVREGLKVVNSFAEENQKGSLLDRNY